MLSRHVLTVSDFQILVKSCSIESRNDLSPEREVVHGTKFSLKISYSTHVCLAHFMCQTCKPVMVSVVSSTPTVGNFIFLGHLNVNFVQKWQKCQIFVIYKTLNRGLLAMSKKMENDFSAKKCSLYPGARFNLTRYVRNQVQPNYLKQLRLTLQVLWYFCRFQS